MTSFFCIYMSLKIVLAKASRMVSLVLLVSNLLLSPRELHITDRCDFVGNR